MTEELAAVAPPGQHPPAMAAKLGGATYREYAVPNRSPAESNGTPELMDSRQVAAVLNVTTPTARKALRKNLGPGIRGAGAEKWLKADVFRWLGLPLDRKPQDDWQ